MKIFLDDERRVPAGFVNPKTGEELIELLLSNDEVVEVMSLDHDLGAGMTGLEVVKVLVNEHPEVFDKIKEIWVHSTNTMGRAGMVSWLTSAQENGAINQDTIIHYHNAISTAGRLYDNENNRLY